MFGIMFLESWYKGDFVRNNISKNAFEDIVKLLRNEYDTSQDIKLRDNSPEKMLDLGLNNFPMLMNSSHIISNILSKDEAKEKHFYKKGTNYHSLGVKKFFEVINSLDNPLAIYKKLDNVNYIIITNIYNSDTEKIIVPVYYNTLGNYGNEEIKTTKIKSIYGKRNLAKYLKRNIDCGQLIEIYNKKNQVCTTGSQSSYDTNLVYKDNIPHNKGSVKRDMSSISYYDINDRNDTYIKEDVILYGYC